MKIGNYIDRVDDSYTYMLCGEIFFSPLFEMFAAMHVICNPMHHTARLRWWERMQEQLDEGLIEDIVDFREIEADVVQLEFDELPAAEGDSRVHVMPQAFHVTELHFEQGS